MRQRVAYLHAKYGPLVRRRARVLLKGDEQAEDICQEVFVRVMLNIQQFRGESSPVTWLYRITTNLCVDYLRRQARREEVSLTPEMQQVLNVPQDCAEGRLLDRHQLAQLLRQLDPTTIQILIHSHLDGMSQEEIGKTMGLSRKTVWSKLERARKKALGRSR